MKFGNFGYNEQFGFGTAQPSGLTFDPADLFAPGDDGYWYDISDLSTLFQDTAGTTPAVLDDPVGRVTDKSGNDNHALQATAGFRPLLKQDAGGNYYLLSDGVDDFLRATFTFTQPYDRVSCARQVSWTSGRRLFGGGGAAYSGEIFQSGGSPVLQMFSGSSGQTVAPAVGVNFVLTERHAAGATTGIALNYDALSMGTDGAQDPNGVTLFAAGDGAATDPGNMALYNVLSIDRELTASEIVMLRMKFAV